ncbi:mycofactocin biosynthesis glycosyltransferase MftF [Candidatus Solirubrobacter pratensis]|uniref:mycofactocin biosynthesis glycosyltransferase MftF n=1 Tax=Candidatus Solirubrobacter pratensis TaxID=1298857 RepID=UPI00040D7122|nr:mycofactocin biosynthesis glycosyltransferase MftF [Candidatus Solirubrobacter pratensis]
MQSYYVLPSDFRVALDPATIVRGDALLGGTPFRLVRLSAAQRAAVEAWREGAPVGDDGALARALVHANLAQPIPPGRPRFPGPDDVTIVVPARDRDVAHLTALAPRVIVVDDGSRVPIPGAAIRHDAPRGAGAARNAGARLVTTPLVAFLDSDTHPEPGWLDPLLPHFADPRVALVAPRITSPAPTTRLARYEAANSPLDRGPLPARVVPHGRVPFVPGAALLMRTPLARFDPTLEGGEDVDLVWRLTAQGHHVRYEPRAHVLHAHRTSPRAWLARRAYYGRTAAPLSRRHPGNARPLHISPWTTAAWLALAARRPVAAAAITATATALLARRLDDPRLATRLAAGGTLKAGRLIADAIARTWWPLALAKPKLLAAALLATGSPLRALDGAAYGWGVWHGCIVQRTVDPLLGDLSWRIVECPAEILIELARPD